MTILQQYYTSFVNREGGRAGFQIKAMSPEISAETQGIISRLLVYHIPMGMDERAIQMHPVALRYYYQNERESILLCSQSCGSDENGRPGNFFAHSLVVSPRTFSYQPPILYWRSPFWQHTARDTNALVPLTERDMRPEAALIEQMWDFLAEEGRAEALYALMCAVVQNKRTGQRIIILDSAEHVALWITAVSCMLPPMYRPLLSFSTYHHDPYQSWFLITGASDTLAVHTSQEASTSYFLLDGQTYQTSRVPASDYADLIRPFCSQENYRQTLLQYFVDCERRFPHPTSVDESLDMLAIYIRIRTQKEQGTVKTSWLPTISAVLDSFERLPDYEQEDEQELTYWMDMLYTASEASDLPEVHALYQRSTKLYERYNAPSNRMLIRKLKVCTTQLLQQSAASIGIEALRVLRESCGETAFTSLVNQREYTLYLVDATQEATGQQLCRVWLYLGESLLPAPQYRNLFARSIYVWGKLRMNNVVDAAQLLDAMKSALAVQEQYWLGLLIEVRSLPSTPLLADFYWQCVQQRTLDEREASRSSMELIVPDIVDREFRADLAAASVQDKVAVLSRWVVYLKQTNVRPPTAIVDDGLQCLRTQHEMRWPTLCAQVLLNLEIAPYLGNWEAKLLQDWLLSSGLRDFSEEYAPLYTRYQEHATLSEQQKHLLIGLMVLVRKQFDAAGITGVYNYLQGLSADNYFVEIVGFMSVFLPLHMSVELHTAMIKALFLKKYASHFWLAYWQHIHTMLIQLSTTDIEGVVRVFSFWFTYYPGQFQQREQGYIVHQFFLTLPQHLSSVQALPDASSAFENLSSKMTQHSWSAIVQDLLAVEKKNFVKSGQEWIRQMQQRFPYQKRGADKGELTLSDEIERLCQKGSVRTQHIKYMLPLYRSSGYQAFWDAYRERLVHIVCSHDAEYILEIFAFWCEDAFDSFAQEPYLVQAFLSKTASVFASAWKEHESQMKKSAQQLALLYQQASSQNQPYAWYPLLQTFIAISDKK